MDNVLRFSPTECGTWYEIYNGDDDDDDDDDDDGDDDDDDVHGHYNDGLVQGRGYPSIATL